MKYKIIILLIFAVLCSTQIVYGQEKEDMEDNFNTISKELKKGRLSQVGTYVIEKGKEIVSDKIATNKKLLKQIILVCIMAAIFKNFSDAFFADSSSDTAFYVTYIVLISCMTGSFSYLNTIVDTAITTLNDYMKGFFSTYCLAIVSVSGVTSSTAIYELYLGIIYVISCGIKYGLLPGIKVFYLCNIVNYLSKDDKISKLCDGIEWIIAGSLKVFIGAVLGIQMIQAMILPHIDALKNGVVLKGISMIPGVGAGSQTITTAMIGSAVIVKNSIGAAGIILILLFLLEPILQMGVVFLAYFSTSILLQPISDKRVIGVLEGMTRSIKLFFRLILSFSILFMISIAIIAFTTNVTYYAG